MNARELHTQDDEGNFKAAGVFFCDKCRRTAIDETTAEQCCRPRICDCGATCESPWLKCLACRNAEDRARTEGRWAKATKIDAADYGGWVYDENADEFHPDFGAFMDVWEDERGPGSAQPRLYACRSFGLSLDAGRILEHATEDHHEDAFDDIGREDIAALQAYLDDWAKKHGPTSYEADHSRAIVWKDEA